MDRVLVFSSLLARGNLFFPSRMLDLLEDFMHLRSIRYARLDGQTCRPRRTLDIRLVSLSSHSFPPAHLEDQFQQEDSRKSVASPSVLF